MPERNVTPVGHYGAVVVLQLTPAWLALDRDTRRSKSEPMRNIAEQHAARVSFQWFDADALATGFTDWVLCRFDDLGHYHAMWEEIRDTELFASGYADIVRVTLGLADGFERYEAGEL